MQVGFQLSYLAVLGIVFLYPKIFHLIFVKNWLLKQTWGLIAVSIAAQVATFPLGLFYFHQFPNYFLLSNMLIIPLTTAVIYGGILLLVISPFPILAEHAGMLLGKLVHFVNAAVMHIEHLPNAVLEGISITIPEALLVYLSMLGFIFFLLYRRSNFLYAGFATAGILLALNIHQYLVEKENRQFIVFNIQNHSAINLLDGRHSVLIGDTALVNNHNLIQFNIQKYWWEKGMEHYSYHDRNAETSYDNIQIKKSLTKFYDKVILTIDSDFGFSPATVFPEIDFVVLSGNPGIPLNDLFEKIRPEQWIIDSSNSPYREKDWLKTASEAGIPVYSVMKSGAFIYHMNRETASL